MGRLTSFVFLAAAVMLVGSVPARAEAPTPSNPAGRILGVLPPHGAAGHRGGPSGNLVYHNGPVARTNTTYAIYWLPPGSSVSAQYETLINQFLGDVAADSGKTSNVYFSDSQYYDTTGSIAYSSSFAGSYIDTSSFPANGCSDPYTSVCLSDGQIQAELSKDIQAAGWSAGPTKLFLVFTPDNVGSCASFGCAFSQYCAYHSWFGSGSSVTLYANEPYAAFLFGLFCGSGQSPNGDDADSTINTLSHEHNEIITDEQGSAWYDRRGLENGDKCAWNFGTPLGSTADGQYDQLINGNHYYLQQEWSNANSGCVLTGT